MITKLEFKQAVGKIHSKREEELKETKDFLQTTHDKLLNGATVTDALNEIKKMIVKLDAQIEQSYELEDQYLNT